MTTASNSRPRRGRLVVRGGQVFDPHQHAGRRADVVVDAGEVTRVARQHVDARGSTLDASGCHVVPGFIDAQVNGAFGVDLTTEPHRVLELASQLAQFGVTAFCPTVITGPESTVPNAIRAVRDARQQSTQTALPPARILGLHAEGPYLARGRIGTHPARYVREPSATEIRGWLELSASSGDGCALAMVTLAPELPGAEAVIDLLVRADVTVCMGHTDADARDIAAAEARGVVGVTHLFNAMSPLSHRKPGAVGGTLSSRRLIAGLIADGLHVDPVVVDVAWRILGPERTALITDSIAALGVGDGRFDLGGVGVTVADGEVRNSDGTLAGSVLSMDQAVRNLIEFTGCSLYDACSAASTTPARLVGEAARGLGSIQRGRPADLVVLDESLHVAATVIDGIVVHDPEQRLS